MTQPDAPNILVIVCDQLTTNVMASFDGRYSATPNIDQLAHAGVRFNRTYTPTPLCQPARAAIWSGQYPHQTGVLSNGGPSRPRKESPIDPATPTLGKLFGQAGYKTIHFGKTHDMGALAGFELVQGHIEKPDPQGYPVNQDTFADHYTTQKACEFLAEHDDSRYLAVVDLVNPHNICQWVGENAGLEGEMLSEADDQSLPSLPDNFEDADFQSRPLPVQYLCCVHRRQAQSARWSNATWRRYIDAYQHYTRLVDQQVGRILAALAARDDADRTLVVFTADHGDGLASHQVATKHTVFYENITRVPLVLHGPGLLNGAQVDRALVSLVDLLPTLCDAANIPVPASCAGQSVLPWARGQEPQAWRDYIVTQWYTEWGENISPGRMVRSERYKYIHYLEGDGQQLYDLQTDPGETHSLHNDPAHADILSAHHQMLEQFTRETGDPYFSYELLISPQARAHPSGYANHV